MVAADLALSGGGVGLVVEPIVEPGQRRAAQMLRGVETMNRPDMPQQRIAVQALMGMSNRPPLGGFDRSIRKLLHETSSTLESAQHHPVPRPSAGHRGVQEGPATFGPPFTRRPDHNLLGKPRYIRQKRPTPVLEQREEGRRAEREVARGLGRYRDRTRKCRPQ